MQITAPWCFVSIVDTVYHFYISVLGFELNTCSVVFNLIVFLFHALCSPGRCESTPVPLETCSHTDRVLFKVAYSHTVYSVLYHVFSFFYCSTLHYNQMFPWLSKHFLNVRERVQLDALNWGKSILHACAHSSMHCAYYISWKCIMMAVFTTMLNSGNRSVTWEVKMGVTCLQVSPH